jgi:hypothetical protein
MVRRLQILIVLVFMHFSALVGVAQCPPPPLGVSRWRWNNIQWSYVGSLFPKAAITEAGGSWNNVQVPTPKIAIQESGQFEDITISDNDSLDPDLGVTLVYSVGSNTVPGCVNKQDCCNPFCWNTQMAFFATIELDQSRINAVRGALPLYDMVLKVMAHEFGHVLDLDEAPNPYNCASPTIMNADGSLACGLSGPQACDRDAFVNSYSGWNTYTWLGGCSDASC